MKDYKFVTDKVRVQKDKDNGDLYVEGYASFKGLDSYGTKFSDKCMKSIAEQLVSKSVHVDSQHFNKLTGVVSSQIDDLKLMINKLKAKGENVSSYEQQLDQMKSLLKARNFPDAKPVEAKFDQNGAFIKTKVNKHLKQIDEKYYSALEGQIVDGFLNGFSIEFNPDGARMHQEYDEESGTQVQVFDYVPLTGISFVSSPANINNKITNVAVRMATDIKELNGVKSMTQENNDTNPNVNPEVEVKDKPKESKPVEKPKENKPEDKDLDLREQIKKEIMEEMKREAEEKAKLEEDERIKRENEELKKQLQELQDMMAKGQLPYAKGLVNPNQNPSYHSQEERKAYEENIKKIEEMPFNEAIKEFAKMQGYSPK